MAVNTHLFSHFEALHMCYLYILRIVSESGPPVSSWAFLFIIQYTHALLFDT